MNVWIDTVTRSVTIGMGVEIDETRQEECVRIVQCFSCGTGDVRTCRDDAVTTDGDGARTIETGFLAEDAIASDQEIVFSFGHGASSQ